MRESVAMIRSFLAIAIPEAIADAIADIQEGLAGAHWSPAENLHITLSFLGEQTERRLEDLDANLRRLRKPSFALSLAGVGAFGDEARLVYVGVEPSEPLMNLRNSTERAAHLADIQTDTRRYSPHVTLARFRRREVSRDRLTAYVAANNLFRAGPFDVEAVTLYRSELTRSGPLYEPMAEYPLR